MGAPCGIPQRPSFATVVRLAFAQRRKTLRNALRAQLPEDRVDRALATANLDGGRRGESLSIIAHGGAQLFIPFGVGHIQPGESVGEALQAR